MIGDLAVGFEIPCWIPFPGQYRSILGELRVGARRKTLSGRLAMTHLGGSLQPADPR